MDKSQKEQVNNKQIAKNTLMLYIRMFFSMMVGFYTSRVTLATLGVEDYGVYGIVGGIVGMMGFLNSAMGGATSRFLIFESGKRDIERQKKTFSTALIVHAIIALVVFLISETFGLWYLNNRLVLPENRLPVANWVFQLSIASTVLSITQVPYNASIIAHERMDVYAYVEIFHVILKLVIVYMLTIVDIDKLLLYAFLMFFVAIIMITTYRIYCLKSFPECHFTWIWDKNYIKPLISFSGWNLFGNFGGIMGNHGNNFVVNAFYGVTMNAASSIAINVSGMVNQFASNAMAAFRPPIIKLYATNDVKGMQELTTMALAIISFLYLLVAIPVFIKCDYLLGLWLVEVPQFSSLFCKIVLISILFSTMRYIIIINIHASGNVKLVSAFSGTAFCLSPIILYVLYKNGCPVQSSFVVLVFVNLFLLVVNIFIAKYYISIIKIREYLFIIIRIILCSSLSLFFACFVDGYLRNGFISLLIIGMISTLFLTFTFYYGVLSSGQRRMALNYVKTKVFKKLQ